MIAGEDLVVVLDQFHGPTPHALSCEPMLWSDFIAAVDTGVYDPISVPWRRAQRTTLAELERRQPEATTAYRCGSNGYVEVWRMRWDSSG